MKIPVIIRNVFILSLLSLIESIHFLVLMALVTNLLCPEKYDPAVWNKYFPFLQSAIRPNHDFFLYHCWVISAVAFQAALVWCFRRGLQEEGLWSRLRAYILNETVFLFLLLFAAFKMIVWNSPAWASGLLYASLIISWGVRIFWPEVRKGVVRLYPLIGRLAQGPWANILMVAGIILLIFPTDPESILARIFIQERFHHFNGVIMAPGWAYLSGCILNVDVICQYGLGMTIAVTKLAEAMGGFSYAHVLWVYIYATIFYFITVYFFLRFWLKEPMLLCAAGLMLCIKFQMFHWGVAGIYWIFLSATVVRYFFDMFFLFFILHHIRNRSWGLMAASICVGISLAYMPDTGVYQWLALCMYLVFLCWEQRKISLLRYALLPFILSLVILRMLAGPAFWTQKFWQGASELGGLFFNGMGDLPIYTNLSEGQFFAFFMGLFIPVVYVFSFVFTGAQYFLGTKRRENIFVMVLCVYGLGLYHYYICRSAPTSYHVVDIPFVFLLCYWAREILLKQSAGTRRGISVIVFSLALGALLTNELFTYYPNVLNLCRYDWSKEKEYYRQQSNVEDDARLMERLTSPAEKVAVLSPYEVQILMTAQRKPLFYYFVPLHYPDPMYPDNFANTVLYTPDRLKATLEDLQKAQLKYVFVDGVFFRGQLPPDVYQKRTALMVLYQYLHTYYEESGMQGRYVLALRRKT